MLFPVRGGMGQNGVTPWRVPKSIADKFVKSGSWAYSPKVKSQTDVEALLIKSQEEIRKEMAELQKQRDELEAMKAELEQPKKVGRPKAEV